jgi:hypothetical protein
MEEKGDFTISETRVQQIGIISLVLMILFTAIGYFVSPRDENDQPVLLLPEVKAFDDYRMKTQDWLIQINTLDGEIASILSGTSHGDLFSQSHQTQQMLQHAVELTKDIDQVKVPAAASGIHEQMYSTSMAYLEVARMVMRWIGAPEQATKDQIDVKLTQVRQNKSALEKSQWINRP